MSVALTPRSGRYATRSILHVSCVPAFGGVNTTVKRLQAVSTSYAQTNGCNRCC